MKSESLVIVDNNATVNAQSNLAHTAHHARRAVMAERAYRSEVRLKVKL